ncbi:MAG: YicC family protein [Oscillospiraceae bacterium]|nr:YicC family protein [Oscillospiraceae bacterium]
MAYSMTGFGRGEASSDSRRLIVEIRSVNHRYCDISIRTPRMLSGHEDRLRRLISQRVNRGKIDAFVNYEEHGERERKITVDAGLAAAYIEASATLKGRFGINGDLSLSELLRLPDVFRADDPKPDEDEVWALLGQAAADALDALVSMRSAEGDKLVGDISGKLASLKAHLMQIEERAPFIVSEYRERLNDRLKELLGQNMPDESRVAAEIALFADRCAIDEEITRFKSHLAQAASCCASKEPIGRKLDFILQEINREVNTIGSKANDLSISETVVEMKSDAEKIREQIQNLE